MIVGQKSVVATCEIKKGMIIYEGLPLFTFECIDDNEDLAESLSKCDILDHLLAETERKLYPNDNQIIYNLYGKQGIDMNAMEGNMLKGHLLAGKVFYNGFSLNNGKDGVYIKASKFNHSCKPNCFVIAEDELLIIRAIRDICPGEELTHCYIKECLVEKSREVRQAFLSTLADFECTCNLCTGKEKEGLKSVNCYPFCDNCGLEIANPLRCSQCKVVKFCSRECQGELWRSGHRKTCKH
jgi:hypothetical protein